MEGNSPEVPQAAAPVATAEKPQVAIPTMSVDGSTPIMPVPAATMVPNTEQTPIQPASSGFMDTVKGWFGFKKP